MFDNLQERLGEVLGKLTRRGALSEADVTAALREVRIALLEADVPRALRLRLAFAFASRRPRDVSALVVV